MGVSSERRIVLSFPIFGTVTGYLVVRAWPSDIGVAINIFTNFLGYEVYHLSILYLAEPNHYTIPWILRIPQVQFPVSIVFWSLLGALVQFIYNRRTRKIAVIEELEQKQRQKWSEE